MCRNRQKLTSYSRGRHKRKHCVPPPLSRTYVNTSRTERRLCLGRQEPHEHINKHKHNGYYGSINRYE